MRPQQILSNQPQSNNFHQHHERAQSKHNQSLQIHSNFILFLLIVLSLIVNATHGYGYNVAIGCGIYFLSTKHPSLYKMFYFYMLVFLTILADGITIVLLYNKVSVFHWLIAPVIEIILKLALIAREGHRWYKYAEQEKWINQQNQKRQEEIRKQIEERKVFEIEQNNYMSKKREKKGSASRYYEPIRQYQVEKNYKGQVYREFDYQEFVDEEDGQRDTQGIRR